MCEWGIKAIQVRLAHPKQSGKSVVPVDPCIAPLVQSINDSGIQTLASCCGHGHRPGSVALEDGRWIVITRDRKDFERIEELFDKDIQDGRKT